MNTNEAKRQEDSANQSATAIARYSESSSSGIDSEEERILKAQQNISDESSIDSAESLEHKLKSDIEEKGKRKDKTSQSNSFPIHTMRMDENAPGLNLLMDALEIHNLENLAISTTSSKSTIGDSSSPNSTRTEEESMMELTGGNHQSKKQTSLSTSGNLAELHASMTRGRSRPKTPKLSSEDETSPESSEELTLSQLVNSRKQVKNIGSVEERLSRIENMCKSIISKLDVLHQTSHGEHRLKNDAPYGSREDMDQKTRDVSSSIAEYDVAFDRLKKKRAVLAIKLRESQEKLLNGRVTLQTGTELFRSKPGKGRAVSDDPLFLYQEIESKKMQFWIKNVQDWKKRVAPFRQNQDQAVSKATNEAIQNEHLDRLYAAAEYRQKMFGLMLDRISDVRSKIQFGQAVYSTSQ